ncbi:MAG: type II toxin-antitoxin system VapC family toxin [Desulfobacterales bacterium]|nr:type II toxin-antitoxin system VapC family toxin [Desulfobacterales bacterium]
MNYLLNTCVISELVKPKPVAKVVSWLRQQPENSLFLSSITIGEIQRGISLLPESKKRDTLQNWLDRDLRQRFNQRILNVDFQCARCWGEVQAKAERAGQKMPAMDSLIAAMALVHGMTVVTRNIRDMEASGVTLLAPWN